MRCGTPGTSGHVTSEVLHPQGVCFINPALTQGRFCILPREISPLPRIVACEENWLRTQQCLLTMGEKSAEGIVSP
jgi:hypothetical protein